MAVRATMFFATMFFADRHDPRLAPATARPGLAELEPDPGSTPSVPDGWLSPAPAFPTRTQA
jgi:hypothetical protein